MECVFCRNEGIRERTVVETTLARVFLTHTPIVPGHALIVPRRHIQYYEEASPEEKAAIEDLRVLMKRALTAEFGAEGFNYAWNEEAVGGQSVPHFHLHIVPRVAGDAGVHEYEPRSFLYRPGTRAESPAEELVAVASALRAKLA